MKSITLRVLASLSVALFALAPMPSKANDMPRQLVVISDLHMGIGRDKNGEWDPTEDFRWGKTLQGFLEHVSNIGNDHVDLVIAGDFLELWQRPPDVACRGNGPDLGCSIPEVKQIVSRVIGAHSDEFAAIAAFARRGSNHVYVLAGNHDAAIAIPEVWALLAAAFKGGNGRVSLVKDGTWISEDGRVLIEHGHQIGSDANRFPDWPLVTGRGNDGQNYMVRPWGELFVQRLFNQEEQTYPIIDNLSPESAGLKYRMDDRGVWGSAVDIARFVAFNLFQTSLKQKGDSLGQPGAVGEPSKACTIEEGRALGYQLFIRALPDNDPLLKQIKADNEMAIKLRTELNAVAQRLPEEEIAHLCSRQTKSKPSLGAFTERTFTPRKDVLHKHLDAKLNGHTHNFEEPWQVKMENYHRRVTVVNSGAFQRLIDETGYLARADREKPWKGLREIALEELAPCYTAVFVKYKQGEPSARVRLWNMTEEGNGRERNPGSSVCR
jgi:UDP-2,3-diacylglucosamine pyrophosphatase LpxH